MNISIHEDNTVLHVAGALEIYEAESLRRSVMEGLDSRRELLLDLQHVKTCDTAGAQLLWSARKAATQAGKAIRFEHASPPILECWAALGLPADFFEKPSARCL